MPGYSQQIFTPLDRSWLENQAEIADIIEEIPAEIRECFANTRNMVRGYRI